MVGGGLGIEGLESKALQGLGVEGLKNAGV